MRFIKVEGSVIVAKVDLVEIKDMYHEKNGLFRWDKIVVTTHDGNKETFGIYFSKIVIAFIEAINLTINNSKEEYVLLNTPVNSDVAPIPLYQQTPPHLQVSPSVRVSSYQQAPQPMSAPPHQQAPPPTPVLSYTPNPENKNNHNDHPGLNQNNMSTIYVLRLQQGKFYVGRTLKPVQERFQEHLDGGNMCSEWTKRYPPIEIMNQTPGDGYDEDSETVRMMSKYGIENVRGGIYSQTKLSPETIALLNK